MKRTILIGFALAVASSSACAYVITKTTGTTDKTFSIRCNSGISKTVLSHPVNPTAAIYIIANEAVTERYTNLDFTAKKACNE